MKRHPVLLPAALAAACLLTAACVVDGGRVHGSLGLHYGPFRVWFQDLPWLDVHPWWHDGVHVRPPPILRGPGPRPHLPGIPRPRR